VELARALLNEDRQKFETVSFAATSTLSPGTNRFTAPNMDYLLEDANNRISDLVEDCNQEHLSSNIQLVIFQVVSSIRSVLSAANTVSKDSPLLKSYPELARQRRNVLSSLSRLVLKGKELQALSQSDNDQISCRKVQHDIPVLANQLLADMDLFESVLRSITASYTSFGDDDDDDDDDDSYGDDDSDTSTQPGDEPVDDPYSQHFATPSKTRHTNLSVATLDSLSSTNGLRRDLVTARLSSTSLIAQVVPLSDAENIIQTIINHQICIDELIEALLITVEEFLGARQRAGHMLEMARKAVDAVRTFLAVIEHVCSNVGELDYKQSSVIPEDPHLIALVLAKEAVYSAITNLVTAVRALTGPKNQDTDDDLILLQSSCKSVTQATMDCASCVRTCLYVEDSALNLPDTATSLLDMQDKLTSSEGARRDQTLSILGRKVTSLNVLQRQYSNVDGDGETTSGQLSTVKATNNSSNDSIGSSTTLSHESVSLNDITATKTSTHETPSQSTLKWFEHEQQLNTADSMSQKYEYEVESLQIQQRQRQPAVSSSEPSTSPSSSVANDVLNGYQRHRTRSIPSLLSESSQSRSSVGSRSNRSNYGKSSRSSGPTPAAQRRSHATTRSSLTASVSSVHTTNRTSGVLSDRSSVESFPMTPLYTPEAMSPVTEYDDNIPLGQQIKGKRDTLQPPRPTRPRSSSINALAIVPPPSNQLTQTLVSAQRMPLPPIPPSPLDPPSDLKPTSSKSTPTSDQSKSSSTKTRRPRGMSVTALRMSFKQKHDDQRTLKEPVAIKPINRVSSRSSLQSSNQNQPNENKVDQKRIAPS
jgi:hypothetical protein